VLVWVELVYSSWMLGLEIFGLGGEKCSNNVISLEAIPRCSFR
jgi:hypothetical protein